MEQIPSGNQMWLAGKINELSGGCHGDAQLLCLMKSIGSQDGGIDPTKILQVDFSESKISATISTARFLENLQQFPR